jgi:hypothetical protein
MMRTQKLSLRDVEDIAEGMIGLVILDGIMTVLTRK